MPGHGEPSGMTGGSGAEARVHGQIVISTGGAGSSNRVGLRIPRYTTPVVPVAPQARERLPARGTRSRLASLARSVLHTLGRWPLIRQFRSHQLRRLDPLADGRPRGTAVVRYYWQRFLDAHAADFRGRCLEVGGVATLRRMGGPAMTHAEALDLHARPGVDVVADLTRADHVPADAYDCLVVPFTMHLVYDLESALYHAIRVLKPGGVLLVNFPCVDYYFPGGLDMGTGAPLFVFWWFTPIQVENLFRRVGLGAGDVTLTIDGNLFARVAYQMNMPAEELTGAERDHRDAGHPLLISARVVKPLEWRAARPEPREPWTPPADPIVWNPATGHYPPR